MKTSTPEASHRSLAQLLEVRSDVLKDLRDLIDAWSGLKGMIQGAASFSIVLDTNVVIGDLLWLVVKRRNPEAKTDLMELIAAGTAVVYVPPRLLREVEEKIPLIADEKGLDAEQLYAEWESYQTHLLVKDPGQDSINAHAKGVDPDDADFVALEQAISASGVFSKDKHIAMMGGNQISIETIASLRSYSRATAIELTIKVNGVVMTLMGAAAIRSLFSGCRALTESLSRAPEWVKAALLIGGAFAVLHPGTREYLTRQFRSAFDGIRGISPQVIEELSSAIVLMQSQQSLAKEHLDRAMRELQKNSSEDSEPKFAPHGNSAQS
ncbi:PIN domain-containing protein [Marinobacter salsuginis]|uniref:PIN domain-containing protein n=1 Tax=Marinobacter salsuginis TaxID=418719 RepID=UPI001ADF64DC|nr:PIN domain-containing protein [Marinobacter salsuginis]QTN40892.1 PIN domain-containing protein [Marinobacter salsuginis]